MAAVTGFKGREVHANQLVDVYRNLHTGKWSVRAVDGPDKGKVIAHVDEIGLWGAEYRVSQAGRERVIRTGVKNVHAVVRGKVSTYIPHKRLVAMRQRVAYNPFRFGTFMVMSLDARPETPIIEAFSPLIRAGFAHMDTEGKAWAYAPNRQRFAAIGS